MNAAARLALMLDRSLILDLIGLTPDDWQRAVLRSTADRLLLLCHRQAGKSTCVAGLAVATAVLDASDLIVIASARQRQSSERG